MRACDDDMLFAEQERLMNEYIASDSEEGAYEFVYAHASKKLRACFDEKERQDEEDKVNGCITD